MAPATLELPHTLGAAGHARRHVAAAGVHWPPDVLDVALLLTSELVTNAVLHGKGEVRLVVRETGPRLRIEVSDAETGSLQLSGDRWSATKEGGRGLLLVAEFATNWGSEPRADRPGKTTWFELDLHSPDGGPAQDR